MLQETGFVQVKKRKTYSYIIKGKNMFKKKKKKRLQRCFVQNLFLFYFIRYACVFSFLLLNFFSCFIYMFNIELIRKVCVTYVVDTCWRWWDLNFKFCTINVNMSRWCKGNVDKWLIVNERTWKISLEKEM